MTYVDDGIKVLRPMPAPHHHYHHHALKSYCSTSTTVRHLSPLMNTFEFFCKCLNGSTFYRWCRTQKMGKTCTSGKLVV